MRDTSDMMKDDLYEDTMMDYEGDGGGLEDLTNDVADSSPTIRDAAERLLTLLGVDEDDEDPMSSSEDEGVELDVDDPEDEEEEEESSRLLHQLVASLAKELKQQSHQKPSTPRTPARSSIKNSADAIDTSYLERGRHQEQNFKGTSCYRDSLADKCQKQDSSRFLAKDQGLLERVDPCTRMIEETESSSDQVSGSWNAGWDACATEAVRYLVEDEGLHPHHPTVLAMKSHLDMQRERAFFAQYTV